MLMLVGTALYACSDDDDPPPNNPGADSGTDTSTGTDGGTDTSTGNDAGGDTNQPPQKCDYLEDAGAPNKPDLQPQACKDCASQRCCTKLATCFGAPAADAGQDGGDGTKTSCMLYGECEERCSAAGGTPADIEKCEIDCRVQYGQAAQTAWGEANDCLYGAEPTGCKNVCP